MLRISLGTRLILQNLVWKVAHKNIITPAVKRSVLESLPCDSKEMLMAARDKCGGDIEVKGRLKRDRNKMNLSGKVAVLFKESLFYSGVMIEDNGLQDDNLYADLGEDSQQDVDREPVKRVNEAVSNESSKNGVKYLKFSIAQHKAIIKLRL